MADGIAGAAAPASTMDALGSPNGGAQSPAPSGPSAADMGQTPGSGVDQERAQLQAFMGDLRNLDAQVKDTLSKMPALAPFASQWDTLFRKIVQGAAKTAPTQTGSAAAVPTAGQ